MALLVAYEWPGNVRELDNYIRRSMAVCEDAWIQPRDPPAQVRLAAITAGDAKVSQMEDLERRAILNMLEATGGDRIRAAKALGIGKTTIYRKLKQYGLEKPLDALR
ncbi:MAG TPA: helix-turn-helix domain-containing protein [Bryobacteraceae bacterium]|nr:helix-turn-helix domain-containing protein [Bryobacteraceae bacterium]